MEVLAWLGIPLGATLLAVAWVSWAGRTRPPVDPADSVESWRRFQDTLAATSDPSRRVQPDAGTRRPLRRRQSGERPRSSPPSPPLPR